MLNSDYESRLRSPNKKRVIGSPEKYKKELYGDRFIPSRSSTNMLDNFSLSPIPATLPSEKTKEETSLTYSMVLRSELLGDVVPVYGGDKSPLWGSGSTPGSPYALQKSGGVAMGSLFSTYTALPLSPQRPNNVLRYRSSPPSGQSSVDSPYSLTPMTIESQNLLSSPRNYNRKISKVPFRVLEAPSIQDDFYLNLVDWSSQNILAVGLSNCVYLWNACTSQVTKLCDLSPQTVTSCSWTERGNHLAVGSTDGSVQLWDIARQKKIRNMSGHKSRVGTLAWNAHILSSGSRDRLIYHRDVRAKEHYVAKLIGHKQEVCGLKWSPDNTQLASGGNDNKLLVWDQKSTTPLLRFSEHQAAVKAIAWSPHQRGLLASGGGTADRHIRFWNTQTSSALNHIDTTSQVCNLAWSKNVNELVSTHGYSQNQVVVWSYPTMQQVATLTGHTMRVLYLSVSPDGQTIVTGAGDETLRFWNVFPSAIERHSSQISSPFSRRLDIR